MHASFKRQNKAMLAKLQKARKLVPYISDLSTPIIQLAPHRTDYLSLNSLTTGVHWTGTTGSGKTTAAANLALSYLRAGFGGVVLTTKPGEFDQWYHYAATTGRLNQLVRFSPDSGLKFNPLEYSIAAAKARGEGMITMNIVNLLMKVIEAAQRGSELKGQAPEQPFWRLAPKAMLENAIDVLYAAYGTLRLSQIVEFILTAPRDEVEFNDETFREKSFHMRTMHELVHEPVNRLDDHDLNIVLNYWRYDFGRLDERTRSNIVTSMTAQLQPILKNPLHSCLCTETTIVPDLSFTAGSIIVLDAPIKTHMDSGLVFQHIFKFLFQNCVEARDTKIYDRPVFLWGDEAQYWITPRDIEVQTTARSSRLCCVYLTQSYSNYYALIGGSNPRDATAAFLNCLNVKVALASTDHNTNQILSEIIGRRIQMRASHGHNSNQSVGQNKGYNYGISFQSGGNWSTSDQGGSSSGGSISHGYSEGDSIGESLSASWGHSTNFAQQMDFDVQPGEFSCLRTGEDNNWHADAVVIEGGRRFVSTGKHWLTTSIPMVFT